MSTEELKNTENISREVITKNDAVFTQESSLAVAKDVQGLRAIFEEVPSCNIFCLKRGSSRNLFANEILKSLAHFWLNSRFFLNVSYIKSADNPADFYTSYF